MANFLSNNFSATESTWRHFCEAARAKTKELSIGHVNRLRIRDIETFSKYMLKSLQMTTFIWFCPMAVACAHNLKGFS